MENNAKIRIKVGSIEIDYEGSPDFLDDGIERLLAAMCNLAHLNVGSREFQVNEMSEQMTTAVVTEPSKTEKTLGVSTGTIAARFKAKSARDLVLCAMAQLTIVKGKEKLERSDIISEMKTATAYYNKNMQKNLTQTLENLIKKKDINEITNGYYTLGAENWSVFQGLIDEN